MRSLQRPPPPAFTLCVRGESFELGEGLSAVASERLELAWRLVQELIRDQSLDGWRSAAHPPTSLAS
jgi:hypothetical protein